MSGNEFRGVSDYFFASVSLRILLNQQVIMKALSVVVTDRQFAENPDLYTDIIDAQNVTAEHVKILMDYEE